MKVLITQKIIGIAGSENYLLQLVKGLAERDVDVEFLSLVPKGLKGSEEVFNDKISELDVKVHTIYYSFPFFNTLQAIARLIKTKEYDLVHSHLIHADLLLAIAKKYFTKFKLVSSKHGYQEWYNNKFGFDPKFKIKNSYWRLARWAEKQMDRSFAISKGLQNLYVGLGICKNEKLELIHYGFNFPDIFNTGKYRFSEYQLAIVGRLTAFKGHRYAIEALEIIKNKFSDLQLVVVGSGTLEEELKKLVSSKGLTPQVKFMGYNSDVREIMADSDVVLIPSIAEGFGVVVLEAFRSGKPIVAFNVPSLNEHIVHNHSGILVKPFDINAYASAIEELLTNKEKSNKLAKNGTEKLSNDYNFNLMMSRTIEFYQKVVH